MCIYIYIYSTNIVLYDSSSDALKEPLFWIPLKKIFRTTVGFNHEVTKLGIKGAKDQISCQAQMQEGEGSAEAMFKVLSHEATWSVKER